MGWKVPLGLANSSLAAFQGFSVKRQDFQQWLMLHQSITNTVGQLRHSQLEPMQKFEIGNQQIMDHCHPNLRHHSVFACAGNAFYLQILFEPFEKEFDLPSLLVNFCDWRCRHRSCWWIHRQRTCRNRVPGKYAGKTHSKTGVFQQEINSRGNLYPCLPAVIKSMAAGNLQNWRNDIICETFCSTPGNR